ncbi:MAG: hypothetical protein M1451_09095 [Acidobacteria bacterium]|nr:hypothetical protein [Acidobacteriota bacterium]
MLVILAVAALILSLAPSAKAKPSERLNFGTQLNAAECNTSGAKLVINVIQQVIQDIDSGMAGNYWAYDQYNRHIQVWQLTSNSFCAVVKYTGSFSTVQGTGPGGTGTVSGGVTGTMEGGYRTTVFTANLKAIPEWKTKGNIGSFNYGCDATGRTCDDTVRVFWGDKYFTDINGFDQTWWGWVYHAGDNGSWVNSSDGNSGDITGNP